MILTIFFAFASLAAETPSLCQKGEAVHFSCAIGKNGKLVSLCGSLYYRFGKPGKIELEYPSPGEGSPKKFFYSHYFRYQVDYTEVTFKNRDQEYAIFYSSSSETGKLVESSGVRVGEKELRCASKPVLKLSGLSKTVPCDPDNALNLGSCPEKP